MLLKTSAVKLALPVHLISAPAVGQHDGVECHAPRELHPPGQAAQRDVVLGHHFHLLSFQGHALRSTAINNLIFNFMSVCLILRT
jgi:hypothetical protein